MISDHEVIAQVLQGRRQAFKTLVERYYPRILAYIRTLTRRAEESEDLCQEAFLLIFRHLPSFDGKRAFFPWAIKIAHNVTLKAFAEKKKRPVAIEFPEDFSLEAPAGRGSDSENQALIDDMITRLPVGYALCFLLKYALDFTHEEIASVFDEPVGTIKTWIYRGLRIMRQDVETAGKTPDSIAAGEQPS